MKKLLGMLVILILVYAWYANSSSKSKQAEVLRQQLATLQKENAELANKNRQETKVVDQDFAGHEKRLKVLQSKLAAQNKKLAAFQKRRELLTAAMNDPAQASTVNETQDEIQEKNEAIQSLELQLTNNQDYEKMVDHGGEQAKQYQNLNKAQTIADLNARIRAQQVLIQNTQSAIRENQIRATADSTDQAQVQVSQLQQQKNDLEALRLSRDQVNVQTAAQTAQIHEQVGYEKSNIHSSEQEIRAQIAQLKSEIKTLQSQDSGVKKTSTQLKQQATYVDQQISAEKSEISRIQNLIKLEQ